MRTGGGSRLNPCFNGTYSMSEWIPDEKWVAIISLNPCFNGTYSMRVRSSPSGHKNHGLNPCFNGTYSMSLAFNMLIDFEYSLNPCFNGTYSMRCGKILGNLNGFRS